MWPIEQQLAKEGGEFVMPVQRKQLLA